MTGERADQEKGAEVFSCSDVDILNIFKVHRVDD